MATVKEGDTVRIHYTGKLSDGSEFDSSRAREPLEFEIGSKKLIPGFENLLIGMKPGETKTGNIPSDEAYGPHLPEKVIEADRKQIPSDIDVEVGQLVEMRNQDGRTIPAMVTQITNETLTIDMNHPLAGKDLVFEIELLEIT